MNFNARVMNKMVFTNAQVDNQKVNSLEEVDKKIYEGNNNDAKPQDCYNNLTDHEVTLKVRNRKTGVSKEVTVPPGGIFIGGPEWSIEA